MINIAPDPKLLNPKYLSLFAQSKSYWDWIARSQQYIYQFVSCLAFPF